MFIKKRGLNEFSFYSIFQIGGAIIGFLSGSVALVLGCFKLYRVAIKHMREKAEEERLRQIANQVGFEIGDEEQGRGRGARRQGRGGNRQVANRYKLPPPQKKKKIKKIKNEIAKYHIIL